MSGDPVRERILDAAWAVLVENASPASKLISAIASRAQISRPTLYGRFANQQEVFDGLVRREIERLFDQTVVPAMADVTPSLENFTRIFAATVAGVVQHPVATVAHDYPHLLVRYLTELIPMVEEVGYPKIAPILEHAAEAGEMPALDPRVMLEWAARLSVAFLMAPNGAVDAESIAESINGFLAAARQMT